MSDRADVTLCIPAWQAEGFIDRTLCCARAQSYRALRILVSIDRCDDGTEAICRRHAAGDPRIEVIAQPRRLGWADNCNALLDRVDTDTYCLYFHDDILHPDYVRVLRDALLADPEAIAAYCDIATFGDVEGSVRGTAYVGTAVQRLLQVLGPNRGAPLRALTRRRALDDGLRFPKLEGDGFWRWFPYLVDLVAAGPVAHVPGVHYERWVRADGLTARWNRQERDALVRGARASLRLCLDRFASVGASADEQADLVHALYRFAMPLVRQVENEQPGLPPLDPAELAAEFAGLAP